MKLLIKAVIIFQLVLPNDEEESRTKAKSMTMYGGHCTAKEEELQVKF